MLAVMTEKRTCEECGAELPANAPQGLCPRCLAHMGMGLLQTAVLPESDFQIERTGTMIGRYKLLEKIGEGGFGVVYMAEQVEPVQRKVALKIIKAGMDTREVIARFEAERQAIALMDHPNIARALDAGATAAGRPYFVMELVRGIPITEYCDQSNLPTRERLQLFMKVCQAVQHAHQKGVIHRDLKPSNVLVTEHDGEPVPKVIDFGVAKALGQRLTAKTLFTAFNHMIGTPAYMSPEQAALSGLDIDTRADIYSLGVLLYELLTGVTPFDSETLRKAAIDEIRRMIRETEPLQPSTQLQNLGEKLTDVAKHRGTLPAALSRLIRGDLDWIVMKTLEKDRQRRYETANGLAMDIRRHLDDEPIVACPPSKLYRFQKLVHRNQLAFTAAGAVTAALVIGLGISIWSWRVAVAAQLEQVRLRQVADADRKRAQTEAARSGQVAQFLKDTLKEVEPSVALGRDGTMLREVLDKTAERVGKELTNQPEVEAELRSTIGTTYFELGDYPKAIAMHREALRLRKSIFGDTNELVALSLNELGNALAQTSDLAEAEAVQRQALALRRKLLGNDHASVAISLRDLADTLLEEYPRREEAGGSGPQIEGKLEEAEIKAREAVTMQRRLLGREHPDLAWSLNTLGAVLGARGRLPEAEAIDREALAMWRRLSGDENPEVASSFIKLGKVLEDQGRWPEAEAAFRECLALRRRFLGNDHKWVVGAIGGLGATLWAHGKLAEAEPLFRELLALRIKHYGKESPETVRQLTDLAKILQQEHKYTEAEEALREALATERKLRGYEHPEVAGLLTRLADLLRAEGKPSEAEGFAKEAIGILEQLVRGNPNREKYREDLGHSQWRLADVLAETDRRGAAIEVIRQALQTFEKAAHDFPGYPYLRQEQAFTHRTLGDLLEGLGQLDDTERHYRAATELYAGLKTEVPGNWFYCAEEAYTTWMLAAKLERAGRFDGAVAYYRQALTLHEQAMAGFPHHGDFKSRRDSVRSGLVSLLNAQGKRAEAETLLHERSHDLGGRRSTKTTAADEILPLIAMQDVPLTFAIGNLARQANLNFTFDPTVTNEIRGADGKIVPQPTVNIRWENLTARQALTTLLTNHSLILVEDSQKQIARITVAGAAAGTEKVPAAMELVGQPVPKAFKLPLLTGGEIELPPSTNHGPLLLDFCASWCGPCRQAMPVLADIAKEYAPRGVSYVTVNQGEAPETIRRYLAKTGLDISVALDKQSANNAREWCLMAKAYRVDAIPTIVIVDQSNIVRCVQVGACPELGDELRRALDEVLKAESGKGQSSR